MLEVHRRHIIYIFLIHVTYIKPDGRVTTPSSVFFFAKKARPSLFVPAETKATTRISSKLRRFIMMYIFDIVNCQLFGNDSCYSKSSMKIFFAIVSNSRAFSNAQSSAKHHNSNRQHKQYRQPVIAKHITTA